MVLANVASTLLLQKKVPKYSLCPFIQEAEMLFIDDSRTPPLVAFAPHPNPPPRRGEGRVGVMLLEILRQRLGLGLSSSLKISSQ